MDHIQALYAQAVPEELRKILETLYTSKNIALWSLRGAVKGFTFISSSSSLLLFLPH